MTQQVPGNTLSYASSPAGLREIAQRQKILLYCILACIVLYAVLIAGQSSLHPFVLLPVVLLFFAAEVTAAVFIFMLTLKLYGTAVGILLGILTLVPCIGLIVLLVVNSKATAILKQNGIPVGLLGARMPDHLK